MPRATDHREFLPTTARAAVAGAWLSGLTSGHSLFTGDEALLLRCP